MNDYFDEVLIFLPNLPREVYNLWLHDLILELGWPPCGETWKNVLCGFDRLYWSNLKWTKEELNINTLCWSKSAQGIIKGLYDAKYSNINNKFSKYIKNDKIERIIEHIEKYGILPETIILINDEGKYEIVDGCHRLTAFLRYMDINDTTNRLNIIQNVWIGKL